MVLQTHAAMADTPQALDEVYKLRYSWYRRWGAIEFRHNRRFDDRYDTLPNTFSVIVRSQADEALASQRISVVRPGIGWTEAPASRVLAGDPIFEALHEESYAEISRLCFRGKASAGPLVKLLHAMAALSSFHEVKWLVACPRPEQAAIYEAILGMRPLGPPQLYGVRTERMAVKPGFAICSVGCAPHSFSLQQQL